VRQLSGEPGTCPFATPADKLALPILEAWSAGLVRGRAPASLARLAKLRRKATGPAEGLWRTAVRDVGLRGALESYESGDFAGARRLIAAARQAVVRNDSEVEHAEAVLLLEAAKLEDAIRILERISGEVPEAHLNLGIAWERKGDPARALVHYQAALDAGVKHPRLRDWIDTKRRVWGRP
jgi:thioredoxin-like negative regulator of GroEL